MRNGFQFNPVGLWQGVKRGWPAVAALALVACFGGEGPLQIAAQSPTVSAVTPVIALAGVPTTFVVTGQNLPLTASASIADGDCLTPVNRTATGFTVVCTPALAGNQIVTIRSDTVANGGWWIGMQTITVSTMALSATSLLVDSGVSAGQCYGAGSDLLLSCSSPAAIALNDKQDGMTGRDVTSAGGSDGQLGLSYSVVGTYARTECVKDNISGLTWQGKSGTLLAIAGDARNLEAKAFEVATNTAGVCGFTNWRLPSRMELQSLVNYGSVDPYFGIDTDWFPDTRIGAYFSSTPYAPNLKNNWVVDFIKGGIMPDSAVSSGIYVRLVR